MDKLTLQTLFGFPLVPDEQTYAGMIELPVQGHVKKSFYYTPQYGDYLDLGNLFTEVQINVFDDDSYILIFRGDAKNCTSELTGNRILFYNALHKILGEDSQGAKQFSLDDFTKLQSGSEWVYAKDWNGYAASLDYLGIDNGIVLSLRSSIINRCLNTEIDWTQELCLISNDEQPIVRSETNKLSHNSSNSGCLSVIIIAIVLSVFFAI